MTFAGSWTLLYCSMLLSDRLFLVRIRKSYFLVCFLDYFVAAS